MKTGAESEWGRLNHVMVHEPGIEVFFALLYPSAHLYERFFNLDAARSEHQALCSMLHDDFGVKVTHLEEIVKEKAGEDEDIFRRLFRLAEQRSRQVVEGDVYPTCCQGDYPVSQVPYNERDPGHLLDIVKLNPEIILSQHGVRTELIHPLYNLYFMRDQQAATDLGMVQSWMAKRERADEVDLSGLALQSAGVDIVHRVDGGRFEGGDFMPAGDFALLGCGLRTDMNGINSFLSKGTAFDEVAVVHEPVHPLITGRDPMVCMHLDTYFNIAADGVAVGNPLLLNEAKVEVYHRFSGGYEASGEKQSFESYIREKGFLIIEITTLEQLCYATNFLCVRDGECIAPDTSAIAPLVLKRLFAMAKRAPGKYGRLLEQAKYDYEMLTKTGCFFPENRELQKSGVEMQALTLTSATGGYGGAHCMTCVINRN